MSCIRMHNLGVDLHKQLINNCVYVLCLRYILRVLPCGWLIMQPDYNEYLHIHSMTSDDKHSQLIARVIND